MNEAKRNVLRQNATNEAKRSVLRQNATNEAKRSVLRQNATNEAKCSVLRQNATNEAKRNVLRQNATNEAKRSVLRQNATNEAKRNQEHPFKMLKKFDLASVKTAITPMKTKMALTKDEEADDVDVTPKISHLNVVKRFFKYLKGKPNLGLWYSRGSPFDLEAYSDSDYAGANHDRKSITGGCQFLGRRLISWQCKKQTIVATSTTKAKYVAAAS
ncbi:hypothetical protein Tco_0156669 [Tanacetum coccineum]